MLMPGMHDAEALLLEAGQHNPGPWTEHSRNLADAARQIAARVPGLDAGAADKRCSAYSLLPGVVENTFKG